VTKETPVIAGDEEYIKTRDDKVDRRKV